MPLPELISPTTRRPLPRLSILHYIHSDYTAECSILPPPGTTAHEIIDSVDDYYDSRREIAVADHFSGTILGYAFRSNQNDRVSLRARLRRESNAHFSANR